MERWSKERAWEWYRSRPWIRGCNYMGSDCANRIDQWQEYKFDEKLATAEREFALMESIGYNSIRLILEFEVWDRQHDGFMERLDGEHEALLLPADLCALLQGGKRRQGLA